AFRVKLNTPAIYCITSNPQVLIEGMQTINNQTRSKHRSFAILIHNLLCRKYFSEWSLWICLIAHSTQQRDTSKPFAVVIDILLHLIPIINCNRIRYVVTKVRINAKLYVCTTLHPILLSKLHILQLLHTHQIRFVNTTFFTHYREAHNLICPGVRPYTVFHHLRVLPHNQRQYVVLIVHLNITEVEWAVFTMNTRGRTKNYTSITRGFHCGATCGLVNPNQISNNLVPLLNFLSPINHILII